jgi:hypothetical protein
VQENTRVTNLQIAPCLAICVAPPPSRENKSSGEKNTRCQSGEVSKGEEGGGRRRGQEKKNGSGSNSNIKPATNMIW